MTKEAYVVLLYIKYVQIGKVHLKNVLSTNFKILS